MEIQKAKSAKKARVIKMNPENAQGGKLKLKLSGEKN